MVSITLWVGCELSESRVSDSQCLLYRSQPPPLLGFCYYYAVLLPPPLQVRRYRLCSARACREDLACSSAASCINSISSTSRNVIRTE